jgi:hypothetical protein
LAFSLTIQEAGEHLKGYIGRHQKDNDDKGSA